MHPDHLEAAVQQRLQRLIHHLARLLRAAEDLDHVDRPDLLRDVGERGTMASPNASCPA
jgi:hypothetical protein